MSQELEKQIMKMFKNSNKAISPDTIKFVTNSNHHDIWEKLQSLEKYGFIKTVTEKKVKFYRRVSS